MISYDAILTAALGGSDEVKKVSIENEPLADLYRMAWELDSLQGRLESDAKDMARRFASYANEVATGRVYDPPTGWSTMRELDKNATKFQVLRETFHNLFRPLTGKKFRDVHTALATENEEGPVAS